MRVSEGANALRVTICSFSPCYMYVVIVVFG
jgi:hypothetical protein